MLAVEVVPCTVDVVGLAADDCMDGIRDKEREQLAERDFTVGSSEHEEEERRDKEHQVARDDGDVDDERVDGTRTVVDDEDHFKTVTLEIVLAQMLLCRMSMLIALMSAGMKKDIWCGVSVHRAPNNSMSLFHARFYGTLLFDCPAHFPFHVYSLYSHHPRFHLGRGNISNASHSLHFMSIAQYHPSL